MNYGANLLEINPLVLTKEGNVIAADAKVDLDDNALWKHPDVQAWNKAAPSDEDQEAALAIGLGMFNYKKLLDEAGEPAKEIGTIANGAGLGMGTMDAVKNAGGGAQADLVKKSYNLVTSDPRVKAMFINIFGGITRGDQVALGIVEALKGNDVRKVPMVIRLTGTNAEEGRKILADAGFFPVETMDEGAAKAVALTKGAK
jgi:succinyl-CoA synthetase beta subunit